MQGISRSFTQFFLRRICMRLWAQFALFVASHWFCVVYLIFYCNLWQYFVTAFSLCCSRAGGGGVQGRGTFGIVCQAPKKNKANNKMWNWWISIVGKSPLFCTWNWKNQMENFCRERQWKMSRERESGKREEGSEWEREGKRERTCSAASNLMNYFAAHSIEAISSTKDLSCLGIIKQVIYIQYNVQYNVQHNRILCSSR